MIERQSSQILLEADGLSKQYGNFYALKDVSLKVHRGELVAVMGENGAGKSTMMKLIAGITGASTGSVRIENNGSHITATCSQLEKFVAIVPQEIDLANDRTVAQNIFMGIEPGNKFFPSEKLITSQARKLLEKIGSPINPSLRTGLLDSASKQMVLIARALARKSPVVIFDEPTANLSPRESEALFAVINGLKADGVGILYVSHRIPEVLMLSDRIEVLRDGEHSASLITAETSEVEVVNSVVGRELDLGSRLDSKEWSEPPILEVDELVGKAFGPVTLKVFPGQVLGVAGLPDSGREELLKTIYGAIQNESGSVRINNKEIGGKGISEALNSGVAYLPGERRAEGIFPALSVQKNIVSLVIDKFTKFGLLRSKALTSTSNEFAKAVNVRGASLNLPITSLSGGNQQKALIARLLAVNPKAMLLDEPTRGVDVGAKSEVYSVVNQLTNEGMAVLLSSSDLPELLSQCHQILVMYRGKISAILNSAETSEEEIMAFATVGHRL